MAISFVFLVRFWIGLGDPLIYSDWSEFFFGIYSYIFQWDKMSAVKYKTLFENMIHPKVGVVITEIKAKLSSSLTKLANWNWAWQKVIRSVCPPPSMYICGVVAMTKC